MAEVRTGVGPLELFADSPMNVDSVTGCSKHGHPFIREVFPFKADVLLADVRPASRPKVLPFDRIMPASIESNGTTESMTLICL